MEEAAMERELVELTQKLDALSSQVAYLTEQAQLAERSRQERAELMQDLLPAVNGLYALTVTEMQELEEDLRPRDWLVLLERLVRNRRNLETALDQLESLAELVETMGPITKDAFAGTVDGLDELERRGYFVFSRGVLQIIDNIVTSFSEADIQALGDNIVLILQTIKSMTQPEIMNFVRNTIAVVGTESDKAVDISYWSLLRDIKDPNVRRGLALTLRVLGTVGAQTAAPAAA
jgi:uncharacterized protein YjgD (DUF1641 family)